MPRQFGYNDHSKYGRLNIVMNELFSFLDPYADLQYQRELIDVHKKNSTAMIQDELLKHDILLDAKEDCDTTEEEW